MLLFLVIVVPVSGTVVYGAILKTKMQYFRWHNTKAALFLVLGYLSLFPSCSPVPNPPFAANSLPRLLLFAARLRKPLPRSPLPSSPPTYSVKSAPKGEKKHL